MFAKGARIAPAFVDEVDCRDLIGHRFLERNPIGIAILRWLGDLAVDEDSPQPVLRRRECHFQKAKIANIQLHDCSRYHVGPTVRHNRRHLDFPHASRKHLGGVVAHNGESQVVIRTHGTVAVDSIRHIAHAKDRRDAARILRLQPCKGSPLRLNLHATTGQDHQIALLRVSVDSAHRPNQSSTRVGIKGDLVRHFECEDILDLVVQIDLPYSIRLVALVGLRYLVTRE